MTPPLSSYGWAIAALNNAGLDLRDYANLAGHIERVIDQAKAEAILADRASERERLAQSGDVERIAEDVHEIYLATCRQRGLPIKPENAVPYAALSDVSKDQDRAIAHYVLATAEAARIEARDVCAGYRPQATEDPDKNAYQRGRSDGMIEFAAGIAALRPDELEKKT